MIKNIIYTVIFLIGISQISFAQKKFTSSKYSFSFETSMDIEKYDTESNRVLGFENNDFAVDTEIFYPNEVAKDYFQNLSKTTEVIAQRLSLYDVQASKKLTSMAQGYYVRATDIDGNTKTPVFVVVFYHPEKKLVYETTIYCYNNDTEEGERVAKSFRLIY